MQTLNIAELRQEREQLTKRLAALDKLLEAVDSFDGTGKSKKAGRPKGTKGNMSAAGKARISRAQKKRWAAWKAKQSAK